MPSPIAGTQPSRGKRREDAKHVVSPVDCDLETVERHCGVGVIRFRRQFSIRSALIAFAVVAALLAMPLAL